MFLPTSVVPLYVVAFSPACRLARWLMVVLLLPNKWLWVTMPLRMHAHLPSPTLRVIQPVSGYDVVGFPTLQSVR